MNKDKLVALCVAVFDANSVAHKLSIEAEDLHTQYRAAYKTYQESLSNVDKARAELQIAISEIGNSN